ncbi:hypothetical protein K4H28_13515 [Deefgea tanakiae]|uniref:Uncharacterized protein n=1 Tax=Deefgea tanakiae TaxID=2865840 RepID=A0ABX8Z4I1_9NEIS|nr:hypothetical protein [Deefgea tanakiae]QZA77290.1 hypothetical protein K4H28_13515 [Deefgea tanakiae]
MRVSEWIKTAIQNSSNQSVPLCSLNDKEQREQTTNPQSVVNTGLVESVPFVPCVPLANRCTQEKTQYAVNDEQFPADLMAALDKHYGLTEAGDYQFVLDDIHARKDMWKWAAREANRLIQNLIRNEGAR